MERFIVIGLGRFGEYLATRIYELGHDVVAVDRRAEVVDRIGSRITRAVVGDGTDRKVLEEIGARESTAAIVATGGDIAASVLALLALRDLGLEDIYVKVSSEDHRRIADRLGAVESVFPERQAGEALATRLTSRRLLRYVEISKELSIQEMAVPDAWAGTTLRELGLPAEHKVQIVAIHDLLRDTVDLPEPDRRLLPSDALLVAGRPESLSALARLR